MAGYARSAGSRASRSEAPAGDGPLSVSQALAVAKGKLEGIRLTIEGEVSEVSVKRGYKAAYFSLKDRSSTLSCLMWNDLYHASGVQLAVGQKVEVSGWFTLYAARGTMNFDVRRLQLAGEGRLRQEVALRARKLAAEGLTDPARKRPLPAYPEAIGVVTSPRGAAVHDILRTLRRRWPLARVLVAGVAVEGEQAPALMIQALHRAVEAGAEMVILGRGGGSYESMMPFNDEALARAVAACPVPVVTGIGHEPDNFVADLVADVRTSTPTYAAATAPDAAEVKAVLAARAASLSASMARILQRDGAAVARLADRPVLRDPRQLLAQDAQDVDALAARLERALPARIERGREGLDALAARLRRALPVALERRRTLVEARRDRLSVAGAGLVPRFEQQVGLRAARLHDLSPLAVLGRGYAIARDGAGGIVKTIDQAPAGAPLQVTVSDGVLDCRVEGARRIETQTVSWKESR